MKESQKPTCLKDDETVDDVTSAEKKKEKETTK